jgi:hypothetical protein
MSIAHLRVHQDTNTGLVTGGGSAELIRVPFDTVDVGGPGFIISTEFNKLTWDNVNSTWPIFTVAFVLYGLTPYHTYLEASLKIGDISFVIGRNAPGKIHTNAGYVMIGPASVGGVKVDKYDNVYAEMVVLEPRLNAPNNVGFVGKIFGSYATYIQAHYEI